MSINKLVSIKTAILDAMEMCGLDHDKDIPVFTRWAELAEKDIGGYYQFKRKIAVLDITNCVACLPEDAAFLQTALLGDFGCDCGDLFTRVCGTYFGNYTTMATSAEPNSFLIVDMGQATTQNYYPIPHEVQDNKIILNHNYDGQKLTIQYLAYNMDCEGFLEVGENHIQAITFNLCWKYFLRKKKKSNDDFNSVNKYEGYWRRECANARALDGVPSESDRLKIVAMLHDPYIGIGLSTGMRTTTGNYIW